MASLDAVVLCIGLTLSLYFYRRSESSKYPLLRVESILLYPIKSLPPILVNSAQLDARGLTGDRTFMLISAQSDGSWKNHYISDSPKNTLFTPSISDDGSVLVITAPSGKNFSTPLVPTGLEGSRRIPITMHSSSVETIDMGAEAAEFFTETCGRKVETRMVYAPPNKQRELLGTMGGDSHDKGIAFQDCASYMFATSASLEATRASLNGEPLSIVPFRPTFVLSPAPGHRLEPWVEDWWAELSIAESISMKLTHNCVRCVSLNINYEKGEFNTGKDLPLKTLAKTRLVDSGQPYSPVFGRYGFSQDVGSTISVGDPVRVVKLNKTRTVFDWPL